MKNIFFLKTTIFHKRTKPFLNFFSYKYPSLLLNLENMKNNNFFFSINKFNLLSFYSEDHGPRKKNYNLYQWIIKLIKKKYNFKNKLNIYLFCIPRFLNYVFNPISVYFCFDTNNQIKFIVYEVKNTHHEQHCYIFKINKKNLKSHYAYKKFYVSPFLTGNMIYKFLLKNNFPNISLQINVKNKTMDLLTGLKTNEINFSNTNVLKESLLNLFFSQKIMFLIHYQAIKIFLKSKKFFFKPDKKIDSFSYHG